MNKAGLIAIATMLSSSPPLSAQDVQLNGDPIAVTDHQIAAALRTGVLSGQRVQSVDAIDASRPTPPDLLLLHGARVLELLRPDDNDWQAGQPCPENQSGSPLCGLAWRRNGGFVGLRSRLNANGAEVKKKVLGERLSRYLKFDLDKDELVKFEIEFD